MADQVLRCSSMCINNFRVKLLPNSQKGSFVWVGMVPIWTYKIHFLKLCMPLMSHIKRKLLLVYANNNGADQAAHARSLICAIVIHCLDSIIIATLALSEFSNYASPCSLTRWSEPYHAHISMTCFLMAWIKNGDYSLVGGQKLNGKTLA